MNPDKPVRCSFLFAYAGGPNAERHAGRTKKAVSKGEKVTVTAAQEGGALILRATAEDKR